MLKVAYLTSADMVPGRRGSRSDLFELEHQLLAITAPCLALGIQLELLVWNERTWNPRDYDAIVIGTTWDYAQHHLAFLGQMERLNREVRVLNSPELLRWNAQKTYLQELAIKGVSTIPTLFVPKADGPTMEAAFRTLETETLVVKPVVGAGAARQVLLKRGEPLPPEDQLPLGEAMIQPFLSSITTQGEVSFIFCGGEFSHAVLKRPAQGDYRIQSIYGGYDTVYEATPGEVQWAASVIAACPGSPLYGRVDRIYGPEGQPLLIELELIEPYLYPEQGAKLGALFAAALAAELSP